MPLIEDIEKLNQIHLQPSHVQLEVEGRKGRFLRFYDLPDFRQLVGELLLKLVHDHRLDWFEDHCGQCGESCRRPSILVREQEIFALQMRFDLNQAQFRERFLQPAATWNEGDGLIRPLESGDCPFLERFPGQGSHSARCSVHEIRPRSCREFLSHQAMCRKDAGHLLEELSHCWLAPDGIVVHTKEGEVLEAPMPAEDWLRLKQGVMEAPAPAENRLRDLVSSIREVLEDEIASFRPSKLEDGYLTIVARIQRMLVESSSLVHLGETVDEELDEAWARFRHLELLCSGRGSASVNQPRPQSEFPWKRVRLTEDALTLGLDNAQTLAVPLSEELSSQRKEVLVQLLDQPDPMVQAALAPAEPACVLCGECCRNYLVEIHPSDITRLSHHLGMAPQTFVETYTTSGRFGWNLKDRILKKKTAPAYSKKLLELVLLEEQETEECVFLERREDGLFYCQVHSHKPDVCRGYEPSNSLCRTSNHRLNPGRQAANLSWLEFDAEHFWFQTYDRQQRDLSPMVLQRSELAGLQEALVGLESLLVGAATASASPGPDGT